MEKSLVISLCLLVFGGVAPASYAAATGSNIVVWVDDALPTGAQTGADGGDSWNWVSGNPSPYSGNLSQQSSVGAGLHEHYFSGATQTLTVNVGDDLFAAVYIDPSNVPSEIMLQWNNGSWEHRAYWGGYLISYGENGTASSYYMGPVPTPGQWTLLTIPASAVGLEGSSVNGMAFSQFNGAAAWDYVGDASSITTNASSTSPTSPTSSPTNTTGTTGTTGTSGTTGTTGTTYTGSTNTSSVTNAFAQDNSTNALPGLTSVDDIMLQLPKVGDNALHILTPTLLEVDLMTSKPIDPAPVTNWNLVTASTEFAAPSLSALAVTVDGQSVALAKIGFKRRALYAPMSNYDLRMADSLYLELATPVADNQTVQVLNKDGTLWSTNTQFAATANPLRYSPAIHVNQEGYLPNYAKQAMVGYYAGSLGEVAIPSSAGFVLVDANSGAQVFQGSLTERQDQGFPFTSYQQVYQADFSSFSTPAAVALSIFGSLFGSHTEYFRQLGGHQRRHQPGRAADHWRRGNFHSGRERSFDYTARCATADSLRRANGVWASPYSYSYS